MYNSRRGIRDPDNELWAVVAALLRHVIFVVLEVVAGVVAALVIFGLRSTTLRSRRHHIYRIPLTSSRIGSPSGCRNPSPQDLFRLHPEAEHRQPGPRLRANDYLGRTHEQPLNFTKTQPNGGCGLPGIEIQPASLPLSKPLNRK